MSQSKQTALRDNIIVTKGQQSMEQEILARGKEFFQCMGKEKPSVFNKNWWTGKVMDWSMGHETFKIQLFRFIDVLPYLTTEESLGRHIQEYFSQEENWDAL